MYLKRQHPLLQDINQLMELARGLLTLCRLWLSRQWTTSVRDCVTWYKLGTDPINVMIAVDGCCCWFSHSAYWLPTRKKLLYTVANPARGLLNSEKRTKEKVWQHTPPPHPPPLLVRRKINKITRRIYRCYAGLGRSRVRTRIPSARRLGQWVWLRKILHSRLR